MGFHGIWWNLLEVDGTFDDDDDDDDEALLVKSHLVGGWALPLWKMMDFVSWDDEIPNIWKKHVPNHQPEVGWNLVGFDGI